MTNPRPTPMEQPMFTDTAPKSGTIGLPATSNILDHRFPLTPEGASLLVERGFRVLMQKGAAEGIHYKDEAYTARGVEICDRAQALACDIVIYLSDLTLKDAKALRRGCLFLTYEHLAAKDVPVLKVLLERKIITLDLAQIADESGRRPFADIIHEIDGRAAMSVASSLLADSVHGKGILLGGVAGVVPCEVMIIGSGVAAVAAARTAVGLGAVVRMFDNNTYRLRHALDVLGPGVVGSSVHPKVYNTALSTADVVVATDTQSTQCTIDTERMRLMKRGVIAFDLTSEPGTFFPAMQQVNLDLATAGYNEPTEPTRLCYINAGNAVPRTMAMALSNTFATMLDGILVCEGVTNALKLNAGLRRSAVTFLGQCVSPRAAAMLGIRGMDLNLFIQFT